MQANVMWNGMIGYHSYGVAWSPLSVVSFTSADGYAWEYGGVIANWSDTKGNPFGPYGVEHPMMGGPSECDIALLSDRKTLLSVVRMDGDSGCFGNVPPALRNANYTDYRSYAASFSTNNGVSWTTPKAIKGTGCARPRLMRLLGGPLLLSGGRLCTENMTGIFLWVNADGMGGFNSSAPGTQNFVRHSISAQHNRLWKGDPQYLFSEMVNDSSVFETLSYTSLTVTGPRSAAIFYGKFFYHDYGPNKPVKTWPGPAANFVIHVRVKTDDAQPAVLAPKTIGWIAGPNGINNRSLAVDAPFLLRDNPELADRLFPCCQGLFVGFDGYLQRGEDVSCISDLAKPPAGCTCDQTTCNGTGCRCDWAKGHPNVASVPPPCGSPPCSAPGGYGDLSGFIDSPTVKEVMITFGVHGVKAPPSHPGVNAISNMYARREAFTDELVALALDSNISGFMMDWEFSAACNWTQWNETMGLAATKLHAHGKKLGLFIQSNCGDNQPNAGTNPPCGTLFRNMAYMDKLVDMGTYFLGRPDLAAGTTNTTQERAQEVALRLRRCPLGIDEYTAYCGLEGLVMNNLFPLSALNATVPEYHMRAADGQYSVGLWPINCLNGTTSGGWSNQTLHEFLEFLDRVGVRSIDIFGTSGALPDAGIANSECSWFLDQLRWWKHNEVGSKQIPQEL
jgi:hypothetical protein